MQYLLTYSHTELILHNELFECNEGKCILVKVYPLHENVAYHECMEHVCVCVLGCVTDET